MEIGVFLGGLAATVIASVRWARVAQREHYIPGACLRISRIWIRSRPINGVLASVGVVTALAVFLVDSKSLVLTLSTLLSVTAVLFPFWLPLRGRDQPLRWTRRVTVLVVCLALELVAVALVSLLRLDWWATSAVASIIVVPLVDLAAVVVQPMEERIALGYQRRAERRLKAVSPRIVAITGSWGKTSTKNHVRDLASTLFAVTISPASFNNRAGLSRTMNEHLSDGTELLVVEMGMYGRGEIRDLCRWVRPDIGVITALGPMHLERVGSLEAIAEAKAEILESTSSAVLWVEEPHLRRLADSLTMQRVWRCGRHGTPGLDVSVEETSEGVVVRVDDEIIGSTRRGGGVHPSNVACAVGALLALGVQPARIGTRLSELQPPPHRASPMTTEAGVTVLDDTFNSNPVGATAALRTLRELANGRRFVVTPGMMELGPMQREANAVFASEVIASGAELVIVGRTNRAALLAGARSAGGDAVSVASRALALEQLTGNLRAGDAVLWENDLPDHYP